MKTNKNIILASQSPRRKELLLQAGFEFKIIPSTVDEVVTSSEPDKVVMELSSQKALEVYNNNKTDNIVVIGADTVVSVNGKILGKPATRAEAFDMIRSFAGGTHQVYTGVTFVWQEKNEGSIKVHSFFECTNVSCYEMTDEEINAYIETGDCMDKAGAYGIQGPFGVYVKGIEGDYNNVVGLPIARLYHEFEENIGF